MNTKLMFASGHDDTGTPRDFYEKLNAEFGFGWDVAATAENAKCSGTNYFGPDHPTPEYRDCLVIDWPTDKPNWMNPPYSDPEHGCKHKLIQHGEPGTPLSFVETDFSRCKKKLCVKRGHHDTTYRPGCIDFVKKAYEQRYRGVTTVALLASRTDNEWFHTYVWDAERNAPRDHVSVRFIKSRLRFEGHKDSAPFPSLVVIFHGYPTVLPAL